MNVRMSYSTELEKVPEKVAEMMEKPDKLLIDNSRKIDLICDVLQESNGKYSATAVQMIDELRLVLSQVDQELMECQQILEGYVQAIAPKPPPQPEPKQETGKRLKDIPRGKEAVTYSGSPPIDEVMAEMAEIAKAAGELPSLEDVDV